MKKGLLVLVLLLSLYLVGCGAQPAMNILIDDSREGVTEISAAELETLQASGVDFILYVSSVTCLSCAEFRPILDQFILDSGFQIYKIEADAAFPPDNDIFDYQYTPTLILVQDGEVRDLIQPIDDPKPFSSIEELEKYLLKHVLIPGKDVYQSK